MIFFNTGALCLKKTRIFVASGAGAWVGIVALSWFYAICSQIIIPLPYNWVPMSIQPLPLLLCAFLFGRPAVVAYGMYLVQGAFGLPFFSALRGGMWHLLGPTGGYLFGFGLAMALIASVRVVARKSVFLLGVLFFLGHVISFMCGLVQLALFVPYQQLFASGLYPFAIGDFVIKFGIELLLVGLLHKKIH